MTTALADTPAGRAFLEDAFRDGKFPIPYSDVFMSLSREPWPLYVYYVGGRVDFVPRDTFYMRASSGPSDCVWIVPGSTCR